MMMELAAGGIGCVAGLAASVLSRRISSKLGDCTFWQRVKKFAQSLLRTDEEVNFLQEYAQLFQSLFRYVIRKSAILVVAMLPVTIGFIGLATVAGQAAPVHAESTEPGSDRTLAGASGVGNSKIGNYLGDWEFDYLSAAGVASIVGLLTTKYRM